MTLAALPYDVRTERGFVAAVDAVLPALRRYARHLSRDQGEGDDLVQETMTRAWAARTRFQPGTNFRAWLFRTVRNACLMKRRRHVDEPARVESLDSRPAREEHLLRQKTA